MHLDFQRYSKMHYLQTKADELRESLSKIHHFGIVYLGYDTFQQNETLDILDYLKNNNFNNIYFPFGIEKIGKIFNKKTNTSHTQFGFYSDPSFSFL